MRLIWSQKSLHIGKPAQSARKAKMDKTHIITLVLGSAAIGALVSSAFTFIGQWRERKSRQKELLLSTAVDLAYKERDQVLKALQAAGQKGSLFPTIVTARWYHRQLESLFQTGRISDDMEKEFHDFINKSHTELDKGA
jgi:hypothetical protein